MTPASLAAVALGGAVGATARYLAIAMVTRAVPGFPYGTLAVNVLGSLAMGILAVLLIDRLSDAPSRMAPFLLTGVLGGFTTFSAFSLDAVLLIERGRLAAAGGYVLASVALSLLGLWAGLSLARAWLAP